jgi:hypothetical protein
MTIKLYNLLFERKTNRAVQGFVRFFIDHVLEGLTKPKYEKGIPATNNFPFYSLRPKRSFKPSYEEYKKINPDDDGIIIRDELDLEAIVNEIEVLVFPKLKKPGIGGSITSNGRLSIYKHDWYILKPSPEEVKDYLRDPVVKEIIAHEIGHYASAFRSSHSTGSPVDQREKTKGKDRKLFYNVSTKQYKQSTEEIQARITEFVLSLEDLLKTPVDKIETLKNKNAISYSLLQALAKKDFQQFYDAAFRTPSFKSMLDLYTKGTISPKTFKRLVGDRFWKIFEEYSDKDLDIYKKV